MSPLRMREARRGGGLGPGERRGLLLVLLDLRLRREDARRLSPRRRFLCLLWLGSLRVVGS